MHEHLNLTIFGWIVNRREALPMINVKNELYNKNTQTQSISKCPHCVFLARQQNLKDYLGLFIRL